MRTQDAIVHPVLHVTYRKSRANFYFLQHHRRCCTQCHMKNYLAAHMKNCIVFQHIKVKTAQAYPLESINEFIIRIFSSLFTLTPNSKMNYCINLNFDSILQQLPWQGRKNFTKRPSLGILVVKWLWSLESSDWLWKLRVNNQCNSIFK